jgi:hypothetical protein
MGPSPIGITGVVAINHLVLHHSSAMLPRAAGHQRKRQLMTVLMLKQHQPWDVHVVQRQITIFSAR